MKMSSVVLVQPLGALDRPSGYMRTCYLEPIGLEYLAGALEAKGFVCKVVSGDISRNDIADAIARWKPAVIGFSVHTYVFNIALILAEFAKSEARRTGYDLVTVFGGPHPTALPRETMANAAVDFVVPGEGEATLTEFVQCLASGADLMPVRGLYLRSGGSVVFTGPRERIANLNALPWPKREPGVLDSAKQYQIAYPPPGEQVRIAQVMYSRGCPFSCSFCSSENTWGREIIWRSPESVLDEIEHLVANHGTNLVYFPDLTFNANKERVLALCSEFRRRRPPVHWWALFRADLLDEELLDALADAGCVKLSLGLESPNERLSEDVKSAYRSRKSDLLRALQYADGLGLIIKAFLILGFPDERQEDIVTYADALLEYPIDELRVTFATPFPGTRFWDQCRREDRIEASPTWENFTTEAPVIVHPVLSCADLLRLRENLVGDFYLHPRYQEHVIRKLRRFPHLRDSWVQYFDFLRDKGVFGKRQTEFAELCNMLSGEHGCRPLNSSALSGVVCAR